MFNYLHKLPDVFNNFLRLCCLFLRQKKYAEVSLDCNKFKLSRSGLSCHHTNEKVASFEYCSCSKKNNSKGEFKLFCFAVCRVLFVMWHWKAKLWAEVRKANVWKYFCDLIHTDTRQKPPPKETLRGGDKNVSEVKWAFGSFPFRAKNRASHLLLIIVLSSLTSLPSEVHPRPRNDTQFVSNRKDLSFSHQPPLYVGL